MFFRLTLRSVLISLCVLCTSIVIAADVRQGALVVSQPHARATAPGQTSAAVYLTIENNGRVADELLRVKTPAASTANLHSMSMDGNVMKMREVDRIVVAPASMVAMRAGHGHHIMLTGLRSPLVAGQTIPLVLTFKKAGTVKTRVTIDALTASP